jgi:hypothetical protein
VEKSNLLYGPLAGGAGLLFSRALDYSIRLQNQKRATGDSPNLDFSADVRKFH